MRRVLAFEIQAQTQGGISKGPRPRAAQTAGSRRRRNSPLAGLKPGGRLLREWNGATHVVDVTEDGFVWKGQTHRSLSAIARAITGAHWSGPRFFGLTKAAGE